jgi:hypothetical protein
MKKQQILITMGLIGSLLGILGFSREAANGQALAPSPPVTGKIVSFSEQLRTFQKLGFNLNFGISSSDIDRWSGEKEFENPPYIMLYITLGQTTEREPWTPLTDRVWNFDTEAIEDHGDYVAIMKNLERISRGELKFQNLKDYVDVEGKKAWVSFSVKNNSYKWDLKVDGDWADPALFTKVVQLTKTLKTKGHYTYFNTGGQDAVIGYETPENLDAIIRATGLRIEWLN